MVAATLFSRCWRTRRPSASRSPPRRSSCSPPPSPRTCSRACAPRCSILTVERLGVIALIVILFDGGMHVGWRRLRGSLWPIASLGVLGTFATAGLIALFGHCALGFSWTTAGTDRRRDRADRPGGDVLGARQPRGRRPHRHDPRGRVRRQRPGRDRADDRHDRARDHRLGHRLDGRRRLRARDGRRLAIGIAGGLGAAPRCVASRCPNDALYPLRRSPPRASSTGVATRRARLRLPRRLRRRDRWSATCARRTRPRSSASTARSPASARSRSSSRSA